MTNHEHGNSDETTSRTSAGGPPGIPKWLKVSGIVVAILILLLVIAVLIVGGDHGPGRHTPQVEQDQELL